MTKKAIIFEWKILTFFYTFNSMNRDNSQSKFCQRNLFHKKKLNVFKWFQSTTYVCNLAKEFFIFNQIDSKKNINIDFKSNWNVL